MATFVLCAEMETGGGGVGPVAIMARRPFEKKIGKFKKKIPSNRHGITLSTGKYGRMLSRIVNLLEDLGVLPCLVRSLPLVYNTGMNVMLKM